MRNLPKYLIFVILIFNYSLVAEAKSVCFDLATLCGKDYHSVIKSLPIEKKFRYRLLALPALIENDLIKEFGLDVDLSVPGLYGDRLYATGDIYIDSDYFFDNVDEGLKFKQRGTVYFEPSLPKDWSLPDFSDWEFSGGIGFSDDHFPIDYLISGDLVDVVRSFYTLGNIYIVDTDYMAPVPLPGAAWLFATALVGLASLRNRAGSL